ncbi:hypothetical protein, partial [Staphylococcus aureus]|uniref:hypothetical protein n=1 Tax=Staphylococcus aureus TaxID=1280 RepID=UPI001C4A5154
SALTPDTAPPETPCSNSKKETFCCFSDAYSLRSYLYRKEVNALMLTTNFVIWLAFGRGIGGLPPTSVFAGTK